MAYVGLRKGGKGQIEMPKASREWHMGRGSLSRKCGKIIRINATFGHFYALLNKIYTCNMQPPTWHCTMPIKYATDTVYLLALICSVTVAAESMNDVVVSYIR